MRPRDNLNTGWRGRSAAGDISWEMYPAKTEVTEPDTGVDMAEYMREELKNYETIPDPSLESDMPRRYFESRGVINLRDGGARVNTAPWVSEDVDISFVDRDPRGASTLGPDFRKMSDQSWARARTYAGAFKDDSDYSVVSEGIHPNTMYKNIRRAQDWTKARMKVFSTSFDNFHNGGVGVYSVASEVDKTHFENSSVADLPEEALVNFANKTVMMSNKLFDGKYRRSLNTTDHIFKVSQYGKVYSRIGDMTHRSQMRNIEPDMRIADYAERLGILPNNLVATMSRVVKGKSAEAVNKKYRMQAATSGMDEVEGFLPGRKDDTATNRSSRLTAEIMSLMGFSKQDTEMYDSKTGMMRSTAEQQNARKILDLAKLVHSAPANVKLQMKDDLIRSGLMPPSSSGIRSTLGMGEINPTVVEHMTKTVASSSISGFNPRAALDESKGSMKMPLVNEKVYIAKSVRPSDDTRTIMGASLTTSSKTESYTAHSYASRIRSLENIEHNRRAIKATQILGDSEKTKAYTAMGLPADVIANIHKTITDTKFGENQYKDRMIGPMGSKYNRRDMSVDIEHGELSDLESS